MDADILYGADMFERLAREDGPRSKTLVCRDYRPGNEEVLVFSDPARPEHPGRTGKAFCPRPSPTRSRASAKRPGWWFGSRRTTGWCAR